MVRNELFSPEKKFHKTRPANKRLGRDKRRHHGQHVPVLTTAQRQVKMGLRPQVNPEILPDNKGVRPR